MLQVGLADEQGDFHIRNGGPDEHTPVGLFRQVGQNQILIVPIQHIQGAPGLKHQAAALAQRLQQQVHLRIVPQGLKVTNPLHRGLDGLLIGDPAVIQGHLQTKPLFGKNPEYLQLDLAHDLHMDLAVFPQELQLGVLLFQLPQLGKGLNGIRMGRQPHPVGHNAFQHRGQPCRFRPQGLANIGLAQPGHRRQGSGCNPVRGAEFVAGIQPQLHQLFFQLFPFLVFITQHIPDIQAPAGDLQPGEPGSQRIPGDFIDPGAEGFGVRLFRAIGIQQRQQSVHPLQLQGRAEADGKQLSPGHQFPQITGGHPALCQIGFQQGLIAEGCLFAQSIPVRFKIQAAGAESAPQVLQELQPVRTA